MNKSRLNISVPSSDRAAYMREYRVKRGRDAFRQQRAYRAALAALRDLYPDDFNRLYSIERAIEGLPAEPQVGTPRGTKQLQWMDQT